MDSDEEMNSESSMAEEEKRAGEMDVDENDIEEMDADELDDELELPRELSGLTVQEKRILLRFKRSHNEIEWEEEIVRRTQNLARKTDLERLKQMKNAQSKDSGAGVKKKPTVSQAKRSIQAIIPTSDEEEEEDELDKEEEIPKRKGSRGKVVQATASKSRGRGKKLVVESESEEDEEEGEPEDEGQEEDELEEEEEDEDDDQEEDEESDDLFDSEEEEEITKRGRVSSAADDNKNKKLRKGSRGAKRKTRSAWDDDDDEEDGEDDDDMEEDDSENEKRGGRSRNRYVDDNKYREDGDLGRIKNAYRTNRQKEADQQLAERQQATKPLVFHSLEDYKRHLLQAGASDKDASKGTILETAVPFADDDKDAAEYSDYLQIFLRRQDLANVIREPFFDDYITGCFVKYSMPSMPGASPVYRACKIVDVTRTERGYKFGSVNGEVVANVLLTLDHQGVQTTGNKIDRVSNHTLQEDEVHKHIIGLVERKLPLMTKREVRVKRQRMRDYKKTYVYSNVEIQSMIEKRTGMNKVFATDYTTALAELQKTLAKATEEKDFSRMETIQKEIEKLNYENERQRKIYEKTYKVHTDVNRKMRELNTKRDMEAGMRKRREDQELAAQGKQSHSVTDPFIRRETRPKNLWIANSKRPVGEDGGDDKAKNESVDSSQAKTGQSAEAGDGSKKQNYTARFGVEDDHWPIPLVIDIAHMRKKFKRRFGVDPLEDIALDKQARYLKKVMRGIPPKGSVEREKLRGGNSTLEQYLAQL